MESVKKNGLPKMIKFFFIFLFLLPAALLAQKHSLVGVVKDSSNGGVENAQIILKNTHKSVFTDEKGKFEIHHLHDGSYTLVVLGIGKQEKEVEITVPYAGAPIEIVLEDTKESLTEVTVEAERVRKLGLNSLNAIDNFGIYEGKKSEVIVMKDINANLATNNARQVYAKITGLNIWESDQAGLQLGIGGRGLSPDRSSNFNVRQNGYDISADALGYPEAYYTPSSELIERIEIVRGAASLQYGTQFGGLVNFKLKKGPLNKKIEYTGRQSVGAWGFYGLSNSIGGTVGKLNYYIYHQYKTGNGYRKNSQFGNNNFYTSLTYNFNPKFSTQLDFTWMHYLAKQGGGLTDKLFADNPRQSVRERNWFEIDWKMVSLIFTYKFNDRTQLNMRNFGLMAYRQSVGNLEKINVFDNGQERTLIKGNFQNIGSETRLIHQYNLLGLKNTGLIGVRLYRGNTTASQGNGSKGSDANFTYLNPENLENSDFRFPNRNIAVFAENIITIHEKLSFTPGIRWEYIHTQADGYYKQVVKDAAGNLIVDNKIPESTSRTRSFLLFGAGLSYKPFKKMEIYSNFSQNYRAINFSDLRISNPNVRINPNLADERGYTADLGVRGANNGFFSYEATVFYLAYLDKIGQILQTDPVLFNDYRYRTNVADARNIGLETFVEVSLSKIFSKTSRKTNLTLFSNCALIDAKYVNTENTSIKNKKVEMVPPVNLKLGTTCSYKDFSASFQYSYIGAHFSDATNAKRTATAIEGLIFSYQVADLSIKYRYRWLGAEFNVSNIFNESYFTRRAESYPGPGIIPADGRGFYFTLQVKL